MTRDLFAPPPPAFKPWKPDRCHDCGAPHPTRNRDGGRPGTPWRCIPCDKAIAP